MTDTLRNYINDVLQTAGISLNGNNPWDIQINNEDLYARVLKNGSLGLGEAYMDKWWDCKSLDQFFSRVIKAKLENLVPMKKTFLLKLLLLKFINFQTKKRSLEVGKKHYDLGNELFSAMLDSRMNYTCGYWKNAKDLDQAQLNKLELTCQKLQLNRGMKVLDIGCGFGAFAKYAAENYDVSVVGITISEQQKKYAQQNCLSLPVKICFQDYRDVNEKFDRIVSLGMFEHVGHLNYRTYMQVAQQCLKEDGLFLLHTIGSNYTRTGCDSWISKYIFPNGMLPSITQIGKAYENLFIMEDWHNFGADYDKTLMAWHENFKKNWHQIKHQYDERFYRMWNYYLLMSAGCFRARDNQLWQIVFSKKGVKEGYHAPRDIMVTQ